MRQNEGFRLNEYDKKHGFGLKNEQQQKNWESTF